MHKRFKKFGLFVSKEFEDNETDQKLKDKIIKYLYKSDCLALEESQQKKLKIRSAKDEIYYPQTSKKHSQKESKDVHDKKIEKGHETPEKKHKRREPLPRTSDTELYFISPTEIKKHRKRNKSEDKLTDKIKDGKGKLRHKSADYDNENSRRKKTGTNNINEQRHKRPSDSADYKWLTKKEIVKLLNNSKNISSAVPTNSNLLKKLFVLDKQSFFKTQPEFITVDDKHTKKNNLYDQEITNVLVPPSRRLTMGSDSPHSRHKRAPREEAVPEKRERRDRVESKKKERPAKLYDDGNVIEQLSAQLQQQLYSTEGKRHRGHTEKLQHENTRKILESVDRKFEALCKTEKDKINRSETTTAEFPLQKIKKRISQQSETEGLDAYDHNNSRKEKEKRKQPIHKCQEAETDEPYLSEQRKIEEISQKNKKRRNSLDGKSETSEMKGSKSKERNSSDVINNASDRHVKREKSSRRQNLCLGKNTFSVVNILPVTVHSNGVEKKKKLKAFKKYYKYGGNPEQEGEGTDGTTYKTFSDSHKMYQDKSEQSVEDASKKHRKEQETKCPSPVRRRRFKLETHTSSICVDPEPQWDEQAETKILRPSKSKIPSLNKNKMDCKVPKEDTSSMKHKISPRSNKIITSYQEENIIHPMKLQNKNTKKILEGVDRNFEALCKTQNDKSSRTRSNTFAHTNKVEVAARKESSIRASSVSPVTNKMKSSEAVASPRKSTGNKLRRSSDEKDTRISEPANVGKTNKSVVDKRQVIKKSAAAKTESFINKNKTMSASSTATYRKTSSIERNLQKNDTSPLLSNGSLCNNKKRLSRNSLTSRSDTKLQRERRSVLKKRPVFERSSTRASLSNSTCGEKSADSYSHNTSFFLTKNYKDNEKLTRWQKSKEYSENIRHNLIRKNAKGPMVPPQVMEVRYLTVCSDDNSHNSCFTEKDQQSNSITSSKSTKAFQEIYQNDLVCPYLDMVEENKFMELFQSPLDAALDDILNENYNFLRKDFSCNFNCEKSSSSLEELSLITEKSDHWFDFELTGDASLSAISCRRQTSNVDKDQVLKLESEDQIVDSCSAPGSEESGYSTLKSSQISTSFFERADIKALFDPPRDLPINGYCLDVETEPENYRGPEIPSIESKSLQTADIECPQKSIQIKLSAEELETINFSERSGKLYKLEREAVVEELCAKTFEIAPVLGEIILQDLNIDCKAVLETVAAPQNVKTIKSVESKSWKKRLSFLSCITCSSSDQ